MSGQVSGELTDIDLGVSRTNDAEKVDVYRNVLTISQTAEELDAAYPNYKFTVTPADFEIKINEQALGVSALDVTQVYDGTAYGVTAIATINGVPTQDATIKYKVINGDYILSTSPTITDVDTIKVEFEASLYGYQTVRNEATVEITPRPILITAASDTKVYDGKELTNDNIRVSPVPESTFTVLDDHSYAATVTGSQTRVGSSKNIASAGKVFKAGKEVTGNFDIRYAPGTLTVTDGATTTPVEPSLVINKTHNKNVIYDVGDKIEFTITVKNIYDKSMNIILNEQPGVTFKNGQTTMTLENIPAGKEETVTASYVVTSQDIINGTFTNTVTARFENKEFPAEDTVNQLAPSNPRLLITKETVDGPVNGISYTLGETIYYKIIAKNDGNIDLKDITVTDSLTGDKWNVASLAPGESKEFNTSYVVTEADVLEGSVTNKATGTAKTDDPNNPKAPDASDEKRTAVENKETSLSVKKIAVGSAPQGGYALGDQIEYQIFVGNNSNVTIKNIVVKDDKTGDSIDIGDLKPFTSADPITVYYTVTEQDIIDGRIDNTAIATGKDPDEKEVTGSDTETVYPQTSNPHLTIVKETTSTPANGVSYALGEEITYKITVTNDGNLTLTNVVVADDLTGETWTIDKFAPGDAPKEFETSYTVKESDLGNTVVNNATATGNTPDEKKPNPEVVPGSTEDPTDPKNPQLDITKEIVNPKAEYAIGETVQYVITVTNTGNVTQNDVVVTDQLTAAGSVVITNVSDENAQIDGNVVTLTSLKPNDHVTINAEYTIQKEDRGTTVNNVAVAQGTNPNPEETPDVPAPVENVYDIHVVHQFAPGNEGDVTLPADYTIENVKTNTSMLIEAEAVDGYVAQPTGQTVQVVDQDITVTILYYKDTIGADPTNPDKPDGIPDDYQVVVRFEAENGTVNFDHTVVTLYDANGNPAANGVGHMSPFRIAAARANDGYDQASLSWTPGVPTPEYDITEAMTFRAVFTAATTPTPENPDNTNPTNPDNSNPSNGGGTSGGGTDDTTPAGDITPQAAPAANTPAVVNATPAAVNPVTNFINNVVNPVVDTVRDRVADIQEILNSDDDQVPLADQKLDDHKCCILHFLIMLLALIIGIFATSSMKKRQKKLQEVREELDCELARRGLPVTSEQQ